jgi:hypothetical protein
MREVDFLQNFVIKEHLVMKEVKVHASSKMLCLLNNDYKSKTTSPVKQADPNEVTLLLSSPLTTSILSL